MFYKFEIMYIMKLVGNHWKNVERDEKTNVLQDSA